MKEQFIEKKFHSKSQVLIAHCAGILAEYRSQGYDLSLRQLYYQLVARAIIPNSVKSYKSIGSLVSDARLCGLLDWDTIIDRGRETISNQHWDSPRDIVDAAARSFRIDKWKDQPNHVEVMVEKQALEGVLVPVCSDLDVSFTSNKGYSSQSFMYRKGKQLNELAHAGKEIHILYLGDHDPSGLDMDRDVEDRLSMFAGMPVSNVSRLALTMAQVEALKPPENPAKLSDSRAPAYIRKYGYSSWELDALEPKALATLVREAVKALRDPGPWNDACRRERAMRDDLRAFADSYDER